MQIIDSQFSYSTTTAVVTGCDTTIAGGSAIENNITLSGAAIANNRGGPAVAAFWTAPEGWRIIGFQTPRFPVTLHQPAIRIRVTTPVATITPPSPAPSPSPCISVPPVSPQPEVH